MYARERYPRHDEPPGDPPGEEPPPILGRWSRLYTLVILELIGIIVLCGWLSRRH